MVSSSRIRSVFFIIIFAVFPALQGNGFKAVADAVVLVGKTTTAVVGCATKILGNGVNYAQKHPYATGVGCALGFAYGYYSWQKTVRHNERTRQQITKLLGEYINAGGNTKLTVAASEGVKLVAQTIINRYDWCYCNPFSWHRAFYVPRYAQVLSAAKVLQNNLENAVYDGPSARVLGSAFSAPYSF